MFLLGEKNTTAVFPGTDGGCMLINPSCPRDVKGAQGVLYDGWGKGQRGTDHIEQACHRRAFDNFVWCHNKRNKLGAVDVPADKHVHSAKFFKTGTTATFPGTAGGCLITPAKCKRFPYSLWHISYGVLVMAY